MLALAIAALTLAGCQQTPPDFEDRSINTLRESLGLRPPEPALGTEPIPADRAEQVFLDLCARQLPTFSGTGAAAATHGLAEGRSRVSYFHPDENLSVIAVRGCSMVFTSNADPQLLQRTFQDLGTPESPLVFRPVTTTNGNQYYAVHIGPG